MQFLCNQEQITPRLEYTVDFIFSTLGFNIDIISTQKFKDVQDLVVGYLNQNDLKSFKEANLINIPNFDELYQLENLEKQINIFEINSENVPILGKTFKIDLNKGLKKSRKENFYYSSNSQILQFEYDNIANIFYHLSRFEERWRIFADEKEADWTKSVLCRATNLQVPVVDVLLNELKKIIYLKSKKSDIPVIRILPWPNGEKFAVAFTHDVDLTRGYSAQEYLTSKTKSVLYSALNKPYKKQETEKNLKDKDFNVWTFSQIQDFYKKKKWKATFFFLAKMFEGRHIRYTVSSDKFPKLFKELKSNGHEIALHPSLKAFENPEKYASEKQKLSKKSEAELQGMRQHYLRFKVPRLWNLATIAKLKYDSSLGYNFQSGFRAGTSNSFTTFDYKENKRLNVAEFPITFFEYNLPEKGQDKNQSLKMIENLISQVEKYEGIFNILIHPSNYSLSPFKEYWQLFVNKIERKNVFVSTLSGFTEWIQNKKRISISFNSNKSEIKIKIKKPRILKSFSFEISQKGEFEQIEKVKIQKISDRKYMCESLKTNFSLTYKLN